MKINKIKIILSLILLCVCSQTVFAMEKQLGNKEIKKFNLSDIDDIEVLINRKIISWDNLILSSDFFKLGQDALNLLKQYKFETDAAILRHSHTFFLLIMEFGYLDFLKYLIEEVGFNYLEDSLEFCLDLEHISIEKKFKFIEYLLFKGAKITKEFEQRVSHIFSLEIREKILKIIKEEKERRKKNSCCCIVM